MEILGVILAGGKSSRMGSDKGLVEFKSKPMAQYAIELLQPLCDELVISTGNVDYLQFGYQTIADLVPSCGPIGGMFSVMHSLPAKRYFFLSCDVPHIPSALAKEILTHKDKAEIVVPIHSQNRCEPLFGLYSKNVLPNLVRQIEKGNYKLLDLLKECNTYYLDVPEVGNAKTLYLFKNVNTPGDVE